MNVPLNSSDLVLIVDDSPETLGMLNDTLEKANMTTLVALEGGQAVKITHNIVPDIILLDAIMPGMDGFKTCEVLKKDPRLKNIPVIFMTGLSDTESMIKGFSAGGVDYLTKPINPTELLARIKVHLFNSRTTISAQSALDLTGQSILVLNLEGKIMWETPCVSKTLSKIRHFDPTSLFEHELKTWLERNPREADQFHFDTGCGNFTGIYVGLSAQSEHHIKLYDDTSINEIDILKAHFGITQRESDVLIWIAKGKTNREIAQILDLKPRTVNKHLEQIFRKLNVDNRTSAAGLAIQCLQR